MGERGVMREVVESEEKTAQRGKTVHFHQSMDGCRLKTPSAPPPRKNVCTFVLDKSSTLVFLSDNLSGLLITPDEKQQVDVRKAINHSAIFFLISLWVWGRELPADVRSDQMRKMSRAAHVPPAWHSVNTLKKKLFKTTDYGWTCWLRCVCIANIFIFLLSFLPPFFPSTLPTSFLSLENWASRPYWLSKVPTTAIIWIVFPLRMESERLTLANIFNIFIGFMADLYIRWQSSSCLCSTQCGSHIWLSLLIEPQHWFWTH